MGDWGDSSLSPSCTFFCGCVCSRSQPPGRSSSSDDLVSVTVSSEAAGPALVQASGMLQDANGCYRMLTDAKVSGCGAAAAAPRRSISRYPACRGGSHEAHAHEHRLIHRRHAHRHQSNKTTPPPKKHEVAS